MGRLEPLSQNSSKASAGKEFSSVSLSRWFIASLRIYHFSSVIKYLSVKYIVFTEHRYFWYQQRRCNSMRDRRFESPNQHQTHCYKSTVKELELYKSNLKEFIFLKSDSL